MSQVVSSFLGTGIGMGWVGVGGMITWTKKFIFLVSVCLSVPSQF